LPELEVANRREDGLLVVRRERRDARPRLSGGDGVLAPLLVQLRERLLERDARFDVRGLLGLFPEDIGERVPLAGLLERALQLTARRLVLGIERDDFLERGDRARRLAQLRLAERRDLLEPRLALIDVHFLAAARGEQHVAELRELALLPEVRLQEADCVEVVGVELEHLEVASRRVVALALAREGLGDVEQSLNLLFPR